MNYPVVSHDETGHDGGGALYRTCWSPGERPGPGAAAGVLGVDYLAAVRCQQSRQVRQVPREFRHLQNVVDDWPGIVGGDGEGADTKETHGERAAALGEENREFRETVETQAEELKVLGRRVVELEEQGQLPGVAGAVARGQGNPEGGRPPRREHGLPGAGVVPPEEQPDEDHAFGPAAPLVAECGRSGPGWEMC